MGRALAAVAFAVIVVPSTAFSQSGSVNPSAPAAVADRATAAGMAKTSGVVLAVDASAGTLKLKDKAGMSMDFKISPDTKVVRAGKTLKLADVAVRDKVMLLRYDRRTRLAVRIELSRR